MDSKALIKAIKTLKHRTGDSLGNCKEAVLHTDGDLVAAELYLQDKLYATNRLEQYLELMSKTDTKNKDEKGCGNSDR